MGSYPYGKDEVCKWIRQNFPIDSTVLDVGAQDGTWQTLLPEYRNMDAIEIYKPNADKLTKYRAVYNEDIRTWTYDHYDLIIFGDIIEHLIVKDAQTVLRYARPRCTDLIVAVPFLYPQGAAYGNPYEIHKQDDLTDEIFHQRYKGLEVLFDPGHNYMYYHKRTSGKNKRIKETNA